MIRVQKRIYVGLEVLQFFTTRNWQFNLNNFNKLEKFLNFKDSSVFRLNTDDVDQSEYLKTCLLGSRQYILKEPLSSIPKARIHLKMYVFLILF